MFQLTRPNRETVQGLLHSFQNSGFNYDGHPLLSREDMPGFRHDHVKVEVGAGEQNFRTGQAAFQEWKMFPPEMVDLIPLHEGMEVGNIVAIVARGGGLWTYNACRIFEVIDDEVDGERQFGFSYATLPGHVACGEERFLLRYNLSSGKISYEIEVYSRPHHLFARLAAPYFRSVQKRFRRLSVEAIQRAIQTENQVPPSPVPAE
ncbi:hypothetical protein Pla110_37730 [Polystyrenella longa]|uniref:DUF1990 domain-containing protein n=1 Tax=Polystyrenella longa TaxID=2528007 RepID=A0A518CS24_9PLAN|nr:DUF1990 domain-containing protein [Polystyrenella longa]QDU82020.1 hypothetical protein Pla110_37730 [Polystyrenella longa]